MRRFCAILMVKIKERPANMAISIIYLIHHSETRNGHTAHPDDADQNCFQRLDDALDACAADERMRWTCDAADPLARWLNAAEPDRADLFAQLAADGRIEACALPYHLDGSTPRSAMAGYLRQAAELRRRGLPVRSAMKLGTGGVGAGWIDLLAGIGAGRLIASPIQPPAGDGVKRPDAFWWTSLSGERLLVWNGFDLQESRRLGIGRRLDKARKSVGERIAQLEAEGYFYDFLAVQVAETNGGVRAKLPDFVQEWNDSKTDESPEMALAVPSEMFDRLEEKYSANLPVRRGEWNDWRTLGAASNARLTGAARAARETLNAAQNLLAFADDDPPSAVERADRSLLLFDERTHGHPDSADAPYDLAVLSRRAVQDSYALDAARFSKAALDAAHSLISQRASEEAAAPPGIVVFNPHPWRVDALAEMKARGLDTSAGLIDSVSGEHAPKWITEEGVAFAAADLPPLGYKTYRWGDRGVFPDSELTTDGTALENRFYRLEMNPKTGVIESLKDKRLNRELVDGRSAFAFGQLLHERIDEKEPRAAFARAGGSNRKGARFTRQSPTYAHVRSGHQTPLAASLIADISPQGGAGGMRGASLEAILYEHHDWIDIVLSVDKLPSAEPEAAYAAFPLFVPNCKTRCESSGGFVLVDEGFLEGTFRDWTHTEGCIDFSNDEFGVMVASPDAPLAQLGRINTGRWLQEFTPASAHCYSWLYHNYGSGEFPSQLSGPLTFRYRLRSYAGAFDAGAAYRLSRETALKPHAAPIRKRSSGGLPEGESAFLSVEPRNIALSIQRASDGLGRIARLRELSGSDSVARLRIEGASEALRVTPLEEEIDRFYPIIDGAVVCCVPAFGEIALRIL